MMKTSIKMIFPLVITLSILTLLTSQWPWVFAQSQEINLIDSKHVWKPFFDTNVIQNQSNLRIDVVTAHNDTIYNRAFLPIQLNPATNKSLLNLDYASQSTKGNATFGAEIRGNISGVTGNSSMILWHNRLNNTNGVMSNGTFTLPNHILNLPIELRLYVITNGPGEHTLIVKKASLLIH